MKCKCTVLYRHGRELKNPKQAAGNIDMNFEGEVSLFSGPTEKDTIIAHMIYAKLLSISAAGFRLEGFENHGETKYYQQWFVMPG